MLIRRPMDFGTVQTGGAFTAIFALAIGLLVLFVIPGACSFVGGIEIILLALLFIAGVIAFILGSTVFKKKRF